MRNSKIRSKIIKTAKVLVGVFSIAMMMVTLAIVTKFTAYAEVDQLTITNISTQGEWKHNEIQFIENGLDLQAKTTTTNDLLQIDIETTDLCETDITAFIISGSTQLSSEQTTLDLSINNEAHREILKNESSNFSFTVPTKDSGVAWVCDDLIDPYIQIRSLVKEGSEGEVSWSLNSLKIEIEYQLRKPELSQTNFAWNTLADTNNITATNLAPLQFEKGMKTILYTEIANGSSIPSNNDQYALQYAKTDDNICTEVMDWTEVSHDSEIIPWYNDEPTQTDPYITNTCQTPSCTKVSVGSGNDHGKTFSLIEASTLQLGFPIDLLEVQKGTSYCFRTVKRSAEVDEYQPLDEYIKYPLLEIPTGPKVNLHKELEKNEKAYLKNAEKTLNGGKYASFTLQIFDKLPLTETYFNSVIEGLRTIEIENFEITSYLFDPDGIEVETDIKLTLLPTGEMVVQIDNPNQFKPGLFDLIVTIYDTDTSQTDNVSHQFAWGVTAINTDKDIYLPNSEVDIMMTVLDDEGKTVCDASVDLEVKTPEGNRSSYSTVDGTVEISDECGPNNFTYKPDFSLVYDKTEQLGDYEVSMTATTDNGTRTTKQTFKVSDEPRYSIRRESATRIYPKRVYDMVIEVEAFEDYSGPIREILPLSFKVVETDGAVVNKTENKEIVWEANLKAGEVSRFGYSYDAPDIAPEFYTTGPLQIDKYQELREWEIASDAVTSKYAVTCSGWTTPANGQGAPDLASTAGYSSFNTTNSAYSTVSSQNTMDCSGFNSTSLGTFTSAQVMISLAADGAGGDDDSTEIQYSVGGGAYNTLTTITHNAQRSNSTNGGYWTYSAPNITSWANISTTSVRFLNSKVKGPDNRTIYVDAVWVEVTYTPNTITMSGTCKAFDQSTDCNSSETVRFAVNNTLQAQTGTVSSGTWTITGVAQPQPGDIVTVYLSGQTDANEANAVMKYDGTGNITGVPLIKEHLVIGSDDNQTINNSEIGTYDNGISGNEDIFFEVDASNNLTVDGVSQSTQEELYVKTSNIYQPSSVATVTTQTHDLENTGTLTLNSNNLKIQGSWLNSGTFNANTGTVIFNATSGSETINSSGGTGGFNNLTLGETSGSATWNLSSALDVNGAMNITYGTLSMGSQSINLAGNLTIGSSGNYTKGSSTFTFDGATTQTWTDSRTTKADLGSVRFAGTGHTVQLGSSANATDMIIPTGYTFNLLSSGYTFTILGSGSGTSRPFYINGGTFSAGTNSTFVYNSSSVLDVQSTTYNTLQLSGSGSTTYTLGSGTGETLTTGNFNVGDGSGTFTVNAETYDPTINVGGNLTLQTNATFSASSTGTFNVTGNWSNSGTFTANSGVVTFNSTTTGRTLSGSLSGSSSFYRVNFNGAGGGWTIQNPMTVSADATSSLAVNQGSVTVGNGDGDDLTVLGQLVVGSATSTATLQTMPALAQGSEIEININSPTPQSCTNCNVVVGTSTDGNPTGTLTINKNGVLRLNSETTVETGVEVRASGNLQVNGSSDATGTSTAGSNDSILYDSSKSWTSNQHQGKHLLMTSGYAKGEVFPITSNITTSLSYSDGFPTTDTGGSYSSTTHTFTTSTSLITTNDEGVGQYLYNSTQGKYSRIVDSTDGGSTDTIIIADYPNIFTYSAGNTVTISTGIKSGDTYTVVDYAYITGGNGTTCNADNVTQFHGYITGLQDSETTLSYANTCDLGDNVSNKYGLTFVNVNEADANETATVTNSYLHHNYDGIYLTGTSGVNISTNTIQQNSNGVTISGAGSNRVTANNISRSSTYGIYIANSNSKNNRIDNNQIYGSGSNISVQSSQINRIDDNEISGGSYGVHLYSGADSNFVYNNLIYGATSYGLYLQTTSNHLLFDNEVFGSASGIYLTGSTGNISNNDKYGTTQVNTYDINFDPATTSNFSCYGCDLSSTNEYTGVTATGSYLISEDHDKSTQSGLTRIVGEYTIPDDLAETVSFDEGLQQFNYADELWSDANSPAFYTGTGSEDTDIQITLTSNITTTEVYLATVTTAGGDTPTFTITRTGGTATPATYTLPGTYTESSTGVQFTIQDGATNYAVGDTYAFLVGPSSEDTNVQKIVQIMQSGDSLIVGAGETIELKGLSTQTEIQGPTGGFQFDLGGTIDADNYKITKTDSSGLNITSTATVTELQNGSFDDSEGGTSSDTYITVDPAVLNTGADTFLAITFDETPSDSNAEYNITLTSNPSACTNTWTLENSPGLKATESFDNDSGDGGPCNGGEGYILFVSSTNNPPTPPTALQQKTPSDVVIAQAEWTNSTSIKFTATASDPDLTDTLELCIEVDLIATAFSGTPDSCGTGVAYSGTPISVEHTITGLTSGSQYHWQARIRDANTNTSSWVSYGTNLETERDFAIDSSAPSAVTVYDGEVYLTDSDENDGSLDHLFGSWTESTDAQSGIKEYQYAIGTTSGGTDVVDWTSNSNIGGLFGDGFESGDLLAWDSNSTGGGDLSVSLANKYTGLYSLSTTINDTGPIYVQDDFSSSGEYFGRFYFNMNGLAPGNGSSTNIFTISDGSTARANIQFGRNGGTYWVRAEETVGSTTTTNVAVSTTAWVAIELHWKAGTSEPVTMWVNGTSYTTSNANTSALTVNKAQLGYTGGTNPNGTIYLDDYSSDAQYRQGPMGYLSADVISANHLRTGELYYLTVRAVNNANGTSTPASSDGQSVLPTFSFSLSKSSINLLNLNFGNSWTSSDTLQTTASTNAYNGYVARIRASQNLTNTINNSYTIPMYASPNSSPTNWSGTGFGYTTADAELSGGTGNRFSAGGPNFAGLTTSSPGDPVVDHTLGISGSTGALIDQQFTVTLRVTASESQAAGPYTTDIIFIATPNF